MISKSQTFFCFDKDKANHFEGSVTFLQNVSCKMWAAAKYISQLLATLCNS